MTSIDRLDAELLIALSDDPRAGTSELAAKLGVARNTVQARYQRLAESGILAGFSARVDLERLGLPVTAFLHLQLAQGALQEVTDGLGRLSHVLEVCTTTGTSDVMARVACRSHAELQSLIQEVLTIRGVVRSTTEIALTTPVQYRLGPLLETLTSEQGRGRSGGRRR
ncbi:Lrp/AsnC family transcriptional regulator [Nonomuraea cavernae]|uniref:Lrp/AsnC family transcriptional regulator n=1 Tax=Nonomuraea cavernae TaxID=2045107 RepID=UPI003405E0D4